MAYENIDFAEARPGVWLLAIRRPRVLNAIDDPTVLEVIDAVATLAEREDAKALVWGSGERGFCAGSDLDEVAEAGVDPDLHLRHWRLGHQMLNAVEDLPLPVIAAVTGYAMGGGVEIALACDLRVAGESARFGLPEITLGAIPSWGGTQRIAKVVGRGNALELLLTGVPIDADHALRIGLANRVVADAAVTESALDLAELIAERPRGALGAAKYLVRRSYEVERGEGEDLELEANLDNVRRPEFAERVGRFLARRGEKG
jgi:enoyl-CoA hydratase/carnithine racemase